MHHYAAQQASSVGVHSFHSCTIQGWAEEGYEPLPVTLCTDHIVFTHSSPMDLELSPHLLVIVNNAAINTGLHVFESLLSILLNIHLGVWFLGHRVILCLTFQRTAKLFLQQLNHFTFPTEMYRVPTSPQFHQHDPLLSERQPDFWHNTMLKIILYSYCSKRRSCHFSKKS